MNKLTNKSDCKAALRKACEEANENIIAALNGTTSIKHMGPAVFECIARCYERHLTPVFEALRDSVIEECAKLCDRRQAEWNRARKHDRADEAEGCSIGIRALKGAPR